MINRNTYRITLEGYIDDQKINEEFEFGQSDKDTILDRLRTASLNGSGARCVSFTDIHGHFFCINFDKAKVVNLNVIEYVNG